MASDDRLIFDPQREMALDAAIKLVTSGRITGMEAVGISTVTQAAEAFHQFLTAGDKYEQVQITQEVAGSGTPSGTSSKAGSVPKPSTPTPPAQPDGAVEF